MADSFQKKEREKKKRKRKKEKAERKAQRKLEGKTTEEFMYLDENGNLSATPPDPSRKVKVKAEDIDISTPSREKSDLPNFQKAGVVKFFNASKGYGFIEDKESGESFFVHANNLVDQIGDNDRVIFEVGKGPKGPEAREVRLAAKD